MVERGHQRLGFEDYRAVLDRLLRLMQERLDGQLVAVALFGSVARGEAEPISDVDLLVIHRGERRVVADSFLHALLTLRRTPEHLALQERGILAEPYPIFISQDRLADTPWILLDVADHGRILYDREGVLRSKLAALRRRLKELGARKVMLEDGTWYWDLKPDWKPGEVVSL